MFSSGEMVRLTFTDRSFGDVRNYELGYLQQTFGVTAVVGMTQVHGNQVHVVASLQEAQAYQSFTDFPQADGIVTTVPDVGLMVQVADCVPVLLWGKAPLDMDLKNGQQSAFRSAKSRVDIATSNGNLDSNSREEQELETVVVGAAHAGRKGLETNVIRKTIEQMQALGATHMFAKIGPCIGVEQYEVPQAMQDEWRHAGRKVGETAWATTSLDLFAETHRQLKEHNVTVDDDIHLCTKTLSDTFFSHRAHLQDGKADGRQVGFIAL